MRSLKCGLRVLARMRRCIRDSRIEYQRAIASTCVLKRGGRARMSIDARDSAKSREHVSIAYQVRGNSISETSWRNRGWRNTSPYEMLEAGPEKRTRPRLAYRPRDCSPSLSLSLSLSLIPLAINRVTRYE